VVGKSGEPARHTGEKTLTLPVLFIDVATLRAGTGGVPGIHENHRDTRSFRLADKRPELGKRPGRESGAPATSNRYPHADARKVLKGYRARCAFRLRHNLFADTVVHILGKPRLFAGKLLQPPLGRSGAFGLKLGPESPMTVTDVVNLAGGMNYTVGVDRDVLDAKIDTEGFCRFGFGRGLDVTGGGKVKRAFSAIRSDSPLRV
jgi:hypothetical protein